MELFGLVFLAVALVLIGVGIAVGVAACAIAAVLVALGVISSSAVVGIRSKRPSAAVRAFLLQSGVIAGVPAGALCAWLAHSFFESYGSGWLVLVYGAIGGAAAGVIIALLLDYTWRRIAAWAANRLR